MFSTLHALTVIHKKHAYLHTHSTPHPPKHTVTNTIPMMYKKRIIDWCIPPGRPALWKTSARGHFRAPARACLSNKPKTPSNSSLHLQSPVTKLARAGARASKSVNHLESLISIFFLKKKDIFKSPYDVLSRNKNRLNDSSWRIYVYCSLLESPE